VVDDDASVRQSLGRLFRSANLTLGEFASGEEFLAQLQPGQKGCLILDLHMPGLSGFDVLAACRPRAPGLPVVAITAYDDGTAERRALAAGAAAFLRKPFDAAQLVAIVRKLLD
jgi:FixJ family two-component response regulator